MGEFFKENLETIMMVSFILAVALSVYKIYVVFQDQEADGVDINQLEDEIIEIIEDILQEQKVAKEELFEKIITHQNFDKERYYNFNQNRFNQVLDKLYTRYKIANYEELLKRS